MDNQKKNPKAKSKIAPSFNNDQLGENASNEFAKEYDNKSDFPPNKNKMKK